jgi:hypothetical protein
MGGIQLGNQAQLRERIGLFLPGGNHGLVHGEELVVLPVKNKASEGRI